MIKFSSSIRYCVLGIIVLSFFLLTWSVSKQESATMDELAHIPAGYGYVKYLDYRLNPEHPPIVKVLAALPLLFQNLKFPTDSPYWQKDANGQWTVGAQFLYESGNDADQIIKWARLGPILLTLVLIILIYIWSQELIGRWWALLPTALFAFSPTVLAHSHYVTTDIGATLGIFLASYYFVKALISPSKKHIILAGLTFGIAQLMKFSAVLLIPFFVLLTLIFLIWKISHQRQFFANAVRLISNLIIIFIIGYALVYAIYALFVVNYPLAKQAADTEFILTSFADGPDTSWSSCKLGAQGISLSRRLRCLAEIDIWMAGNKFLRPLAEYLLGVLMVMQRSAGGNSGYFLGEVSSAGWWYYFPVIFALKEPISSLFIIALSLILSFWNILKNLRIRKFFDYLGANFAEFVMIAFVIFYWAYSIKSPLNIGIRHILPTMPFIYILSAGAIKKWIVRRLPSDENWLLALFSFTINFAKLSLKSVLIIFLIVWYITETLFSYPYYLSYFNQLGGGIKNGYIYAVDSNYDWGQDLKRLANWVRERNNDDDYNNDIDKIAVDYFGGGNVKYYLGNKAEYWGSAKGDPRKENIEYLAVSINSLQGALGKLHPGQLRKPEDEYQWLKETKNPYQPDAKAGTSIFIYKL